MGAIRRAGSRKRQLSWTANCSGSFVARSTCWVAGKSVVRPHILVESAGSPGARGRYGANARSPVAERAMDRCLHLQGRASRHGSGAWLGLSAFVVVPSLKAIIVRQGSNAKFSDAHFLRLVL